MASLPRVVVVGGGAGGLELVTKLGAQLGKKQKAVVTLIDRNPTHVWKPLLHEVAAGTMNAFHDECNYFIHAAKHHYEFQLGSMMAIDREKRQVLLGEIVGEQGRILVEKRKIDYDVLVIAVGSTCNDFNTPGAIDHCIFLDSRKKADSFHNKFLEHYMIAHTKAQDQSDNNKVAIAIIGAGATGVELAAELHYAAKQYARLGLDEISAKNVSITLIEAGPRILPALSVKVAGMAAKELSHIGVDVLTNEKVVEITQTGIKTGSGKYIPSTLNAWCAGIKAPDFLKHLDGLETNRINQIIIKPTLQTNVDPSIFAIGDCAFCQLETGIVPPRAQAAHQQASLLVKNIIRKLQGDPLIEFVYKDRGSLISLSQKNSIGTLMGNLLGNVNVYGFLAKIMYASLYRGHQMAIHGFIKTMILIISDVLGRSTGQRTKLH